MTGGVKPACACVVAAMNSRWKRVAIMFSLLVKVVKKLTEGRQPIFFMYCTGRSAGSPLTVHGPLSIMITVGPDDHVLAQDVHDEV